MNYFNYYNPTKIFFGENAIEKIKNIIPEYNNILLCYGMGSVKKTGLLNKIKDKLKEFSAKNIMEFGDIPPNPTTESVRKGIDICKSNNIDLIIALGGGSVIDASKLISAGSKSNEDFYEQYFVKKEKVLNATDIITIPTMSGTGSETNSNAVVTDVDTKIKSSFADEKLFPKIAVLDPTYLYSIPKYQLISGSIDTLSHIFEIYFSEPEESNISDDIAITLMKSLIDNLNIAVNNPTNYAARSNLMWISSIAVSGFLTCGKRGDWMPHFIEHALSGLFDVSHGIGLAIIHPAYFRFIYKNALHRFCNVAKNVFEIDKGSKTDEEYALSCIEKISDYFISLGAPAKLRDVGINEKDIESIVNNTYLMKRSYSDLTKDNVKDILFTII